MNTPEEGGRFCGLVRRGVELVDWTAVGSLSEDTSDASGFTGLISGDRPFFGANSGFAERAGSRYVVLGVRFEFVGAAVVGLEVV